MAKQSLIDKAIAQLESEMAVLQLAIAKLRAQQTKAVVRRPRAVKSEAAS